MRKIVGICMVGIVSLGITFGIASGDDKEEAKPKYTIKEVMKIAHKDKLLNKVTAGTASDKEKSQLLDVYISLLESKPKKGEEDSWHKLSGAAVVAAAKVAVGREGAVAELKKATNCKACHSVHK